MTENILEVRDLRAGYGSDPDILKGVNLNVARGTSCCIIGPNGAGKSTVLKAIAGTLKTRGGQVMFDGAPLSGVRPDQRLARGLCFVTQDRPLFGSMTVRENLKMAGYTLKSRAEVARRIDDAFEVFPILAEKQSQRARNLSGGQQQVLALARACVLRPSLLMVDEPSLGLAPKVRAEVFGVLRQFKDAGMSVLLVEQNVREGLAFADWAYVLDLGRNEFDGSSETVLENPAMRELYLGKSAHKETTT
jgi:branched-chain amino acid transport system ATP-binding protein